MQTCKVESEFLITKMQSQILVLTVRDQSSKFKIERSEYQSIRLKCLSHTPAKWKNANGRSTIYLHIGNPNSSSSTAETVDKGNL